MFKTYIPLFILSLTGIVACRQTGDGPSGATPDAPLFTRLPSSLTGIDFRNDLIYDRDFNIYRYRNFYNGGGVGIGDINNDGLQDVFFSSNMGENRLYLNKGDWKFEDITQKAGVQGKGSWSTGVAMADINGDGWLDIYVCNSGNARSDEKSANSFSRVNELFVNNGDGTFTERAAEFGLADRGLTTHTAFFDYDHDGDLDAYILNNSFRPIGSFDLRKNLRYTRDSLGGHKLLRNDNGHFTDVSQQAGILGSIIAFGLGVTVGDIDMDGWEDIYVSNDFFERDYLYHNNGDGTFSEVLEKEMRHISAASMGADMADINNDAYPDIFVTDMLPEPDYRIKTTTSFDSPDRFRYTSSYGYYNQFTRNMLHLNNANGTFSEIACLGGVEATDWSWGALMFDMDNDGWRDLFVANGIAQDLTNQDYLMFASDPAFKREIIGKGDVDFKRLIDSIPSEKISNYAFRNNRDLTFTNVTGAWGLAQKSFSNGSAYGDLDNDGDLDLIVNNIESEALVYRNTAADLKQSNWLQIRIEGVKGNPTGVGTRVRVTAGGKTWQQELTPVRGFFSCNEPLLQFGLGDIGSIDKIEALFPPGNKLVTLTNQPANQRIKLKIADAKPGALEPIIRFQQAHFNEISGARGLSFEHKEDSYSDFDNERLLPWRLSTPGPGMATGDVNGDGLEDFYIGGSAGSAGALFTQQADGRFTRLAQGTWDADAAFEDTGALIFDANGDGFNDLLVASGGNSAPAGREIYRPRLYLNDGAGNFTRNDKALPAITDSGSAVAVFDYDSDGDGDIFLGGWCVPGAYPLAPNSHVLRNDKGIFTDVTAQVAPQFAQCGMVRDIVFADLNGDKKPEMLVAGEWMPLTVFQLKGNKFENATTAFGLDQSNGFWRSLVVADFDGDGDQDFAAGNLGYNTRLEASAEEPLHIYAKDFDKNGSVDPLMSYTKKGVEYPLVLRDKLLKQLPSLKKKFVRNATYAYAILEDLYPRSELNTAFIGTANMLGTTYFENQGGKFTAKPLPNAA
ncbi:MAG: VCBS repeat-containing protein, partial [Saprospiraceae bacterium]|nr:VCBS repeat-containing protein [Saprospiraceae bacterium]